MPVLGEHRVLWGFSHTLGQTGRVGLTLYMVWDEK